MHGMLQTALTSMIVLVAIIMTGFILLQESKGGALTVLDSTRDLNIDTVTNPIRKATGVLAALFFVLVTVRAMLG